MIRQIGRLFFFLSWLVMTQINAQSYDWLDTLVQDQHAALDVPGIAIAIVDSTGVAAISVAGLRQRGKVNAVTSSDRWHLGSCTKAMTAMLYAGLVLDDKARWGATLPELFPDLADDMDNAWREVRIEDLLDHTAGIGNLGIAWLLKRHSDKRPIEEQRAATVRQLLTAPPRSQVGQFEYSNFGYIVAGHAIEIILQESWEDAMLDGLPGQLMGSDGFGFGPPQGAQPVGHRRRLLWGSGAVGQTWAKADNPQALGPAGTVHASLTAWASFVSAFFDSSDVLPEATRQKLVTPQREQSDYALGWGRYHSDVLGPALSHSGSNTMWIARADVFPTSNLAVLVVINQGDDAALAANDQVADLVVSRLSAIAAAAGP